MLVLRLPFPQNPAPQLPINDTKDKAMHPFWLMNARSLVLWWCSIDRRKNLKVHVINEERQFPQQCQHPEMWVARIHETHFQRVATGSVKKERGKINLL